MSAEPGFQITGDAHGASIASHQMSREEVEYSLRRLLTSMYAERGVFISADDITLANIAMEEAHSAMDSAVKWQHRNRVMIYVLWGSVALNVAAAIFNIAGALSR